MLDVASCYATDVSAVLLFSSISMYSEDSLGHGHECGLQTSVSLH